MNNPGKTHQILPSLKQKGILADILTCVYTHAIRHGATQDVAHFSAVNGNGFVTNQVRQFLGHTEKACQHGITEDYVGAPTQDFYNDRVNLEYGHR